MAHISQEAYKLTGCVH